jgi:hypothetical protein
MMRRVLPAVLALFLLGCGQGLSSAGSPRSAAALGASPAKVIQSVRAEQACLQSTYNTISMPLAAYDTTAGALVGWQARLLPGLAPGEHPADWWGAYPPEMYAALCYLAARDPIGYPITCPAPLPAVQPSTVICADRVAVGIGANGVEMVISFGMHNFWPPTNPPV